MKKKILKIFLSIIASFLLLIIAAIFILIPMRERALEKQIAQSTLFHRSANSPQTRTSDLTATTNSTATQLPLAATESRNTTVKASPQTWTATGKSSITLVVTKTPSREAIRKEFDSGEFSLSMRVLKGPVIFALQSVECSLWLCKPAPNSRIGKLDNGLQVAFGYDLFLRDYPDKARKYLHAFIDATPSLATAPARRRQGYVGRPTGVAGG